jgi:hypothetical protein
MSHDAIVAEAGRRWKTGLVVEHSGEGSSTAAVVIGLLGAGLTNAVSMRAGSTLAEILPESGVNRQPWLSNTTVPPHGTLSISATYAACTSSLQLPAQHCGST